MASSERPNPLAAYGQWLAETPSTWPAAALVSAHRQWLDTVAVMLPGALEPACMIAHETVAGWGSGNAVAVGRSTRLAPPWAALINGTAGHALDYDDNFDPPKAHISTVLVPAILALVDEIELTGTDLIDAYIAAVQIQGRIGQGLNPPHRNRGWHATATTGALGAAAAVARLYRLDAERAAMALSIATSLAGGFMSQFGTMTKPLHAGLAAKAGVLAASLARNGLTAGWETLDGVHGMNRLMVGPDYQALHAALAAESGPPEHGQNLAFETDAIGEPLLILEHGFRVKRFANCGSAHRAMDALLDIMAHERFTADQVQSVQVTAPKVHLTNLMYQAPENGLQAKFSMEYALACLLDHGACPLADFTDAAVRRPALRSLLKKIERRAIDLPESQVMTEVVVRLGDGRRLAAAVDMPQGSKAAPFPTAQYWSKFDECAAVIARDDDRRRLRAVLEHLPELTAARELSAALAIPLKPML